MKSLKVKSCLIIALAFVFFATLGAAFTKVFSASADPVTISGSSVFYTAGDAKVRASGDGTENEKHYTMFVLEKDGDAINYNRNNLAYKWFENSATTTKTEGEGENETTVTVEDVENPTPKEGWFNMEIGFKALDFAKFYITFESQQYVKTKDEKTTNYIIFVPSETDGKVKVAIGNDKEKEPDTEINADEITITFGESAIGGNYAVTVTDKDGEKETDAFENIGGTFSKYSTSSKTPVTPLSFKAEFGGEEEETKEGTACMALYSLNGQSFELTGAKKANGDKYYGEGTINDNVAPVMCLNQNLNYINEGTELNTSFFTVIDVIKQSPSSTTAYFILDKDPPENFDPENMKEGDDSAFKVLKDGDGQLIWLHVDHYKPADTEYNKHGVVYEGDFTPNGAVKVYFKLTDTSYQGTSAHVLLDWYVEDKYLVEVDGVNYLAVATDKKGVTYTYTDTAAKESKPESSAAWTEAVNNYKDAVAEAAKDLKAGSKNYFYVPAAEDLFKDNATDFTDLSFTVFYMTPQGTSFSTSSGKASALSIPLNSSVGEYVFTIIASDAAGNKMFYYEDGEEVEITSTASEVSKIYNDEDKSKYLPWFRFNVETSEMSVEKPEEQDVAYKGSEYSFEFEINAVSSTYTATYELYVFMNDRYYKDNGKSLSYEEFMETKDQLLKEHREWFDRILSTSDFEAGSEDDDKFGDYQWNGSSRFTPQQGNAFYLVKLVVTDNEDKDRTVTEYMGIAASIKVRPLKGEDTWLQDNMTSVILLCVAGAAFIGIILLLVIKPTNKGDIDENVFLSEKKTKKSKKQ